MRVEPEARIEALERRVRALTYVAAALADAMKWHLHGAAGTDRASLDKAISILRRDVLGEHE